jgi:hypothetical protein
VSAAPTGDVIPAGSKISIETLSRRYQQSEEFRSLNAGVFEQGWGKGVSAAACPPPVSTEAHSVPAQLGRSRQRFLGVSVQTEDA